MEELVDLGLVRSLGVSNFRVEDIKQILVFARIKPVINQVEFHPYLQQTELHQLCRWGKRPECGGLYILCARLCAGGVIGPGR